MTMPADVDAAMVALVLLLAVVCVLALETRRLRRLVQRRDVMVAALREQVRLQGQMGSSVERLALDLLPVLQAYKSGLLEAGERVQTARGTAGRGESGGPVTARPTVIVRRGETETFRLLDQRLGKPGLALVVWDRRRRERRSAPRPREPERRRRERRGPQPVTWRGLGYVVVSPRGRHLNVVA